MERNPTEGLWIFELNAERDQRLSALLTLAQQGDRDAYAAFLSETAVLIRGYLSRRIADGEIVEDVLQEILITVHRVRHTFLPGRPVGPWLYAIADHRLCDSARKIMRIERNEVALSPETMDLADPASAEASDDRAEAIREALADLPKSQRSVIEMLKIQDMSVREVATLTGMSESSVKVTAFRGYETLRKLLGVRSK